MRNHPSELTRPHAHMLQENRAWKQLIQLTLLQDILFRGSFSFQGDPDLAMYLLILLFHVLLHKAYETYGSP